MEKLIELLNEWVNHMMPGGAEYYSKGNSIYLKFKAPLSGEGKIEDEVICSKRYGFIERLVKNDKTNEYMITEIMINSQRRYTGKDKTTAQRVDENYSDLLLMLLAISDNPIDLLCERLK